MFSIYILDMSLIGTASTREQLIKGLHANLGNWWRQGQLESYWYCCALFCTGIYYRDGIMGAMASQITCLTIVYSTVYSGADQRKYQSSASLAFVRGIPQWSMNSPHKWPVTRVNVSIWWRHHVSANNMMICTNQWPWQFISGISIHQAWSRRADPS